jgi:hypothetical protein
MPEQPVCGFFRFGQAFRPAGWFVADDPAPGSEQVPWGSRFPMMRRQFLAATAACALSLAFVGHTLAQGVIGSGHVLGNGTSSPAAPTDTQLIEVMNQTGSALGTGVATALGLGVNTTGGVATLPLTGQLSPIGTIALLRAATSTTLPGTVTFVEGYYALADGGEGMFEYKSSDATSSDNGGTIIVDASSRRWYRATNGADYSLRWFGSKGNGSTDDTTPVTSCATAAMAAGRGIRVPQGNFVINSGPIAIVPTSAFRMKGDGIGISTLSCSNAASSLFTFTSTNYVTTPIEICDLTVSGSASATSGTMLNFSGGCAGLNLHNVNLLNGFNAISLAGTGTSQGFQLRDLTLVGFVNDGIIIQIGAGGLGVFENIQMNTGANASGAGISMSGGQGLWMTDIDIQGPPSCILMIAGSGQTIQDISMKGVWADGAARGATTAAIGINIAGGAGTTRRVTLTDCRASAMPGAIGLEMSNVECVQIIGGRYIANGLDGINLETGCNRILIDGAECTANSQASSGVSNGITVNATCTNIEITNCYCGVTNEFPTATQSYGIVLATQTGTFFSIYGNRVSGNVNGGLANDLSGGTVNIPGGWNI